MKQLWFILLFPALLWAQWEPAGYQKWHNTAKPTEYRARIGGELANYSPTLNSWAPIENNWLTVQDTLHTNRRDVLKVDVSNAGESFITVVFEGDTYTVRQKLNRLIWLNTQTWDTTNIFTAANWANVSSDSNVVAWTNVFSGINYQILKFNASVAHRMLFKKAFLDAAVNYYNGRADSNYLALGNVITYTLVGVDNADSALGDLDGRVLKRWANYVFQLENASLHFTGSELLTGDSAEAIRVHHKWLRWQNKIVCVEWVKMKWLKAAHVA